MIGGPRLATAAGQNNYRYLEHLVSTPLAILQGAKDDPALVLNQRLAVESLQEFGATQLHYHEFPELGHSFEFHAVDWVDFLGAARRDPFPAQLVRTFATSGEGRNSWVEITGGDDDVADGFPLRTTKSRWDRMDEEDRRRLVMEQGEAHTARLEATRGDTGAITLKTRRVSSLRILLLQAAIPESGSLRVRVNARNKRFEVHADPSVLLRDFAERLDRAFLPVAEVVIEL